MQEAADMTVREFDIQSTTVGRITYITVTLVLPTVYEAEGYLLVTLPSTVTINQTYFSCLYYIGFSSDSDLDQCSI